MILGSIYLLSAVVHEGDNADEWQFTAAGRCEFIVLGFNELSRAISVQWRRSLERMCFGVENPYDPSFST